MVNLRPRSSSWNFSLMVSRSAMVCVGCQMSHCMLYTGIEEYLASSAIQSWPPTRVLRTPTASPMRERTWMVSSGVSPWPTCVPLGVR